MQFWKRDKKGRATERRQLIYIYSVERGRAPGGYVELKATKRGPFWASVEPLTETQRVKFQAVSVDATHRVTLDGAIGAAEGDRIEFEGRTFDVLTIQRVDEGRRDKVIITQEIRPGQKK